MFKEMLRGRRKRKENKNRQINKKIREKGNKQNCLANSPYSPGTSY